MRGRKEEVPGVEVGKQNQRHTLGLFVFRRNIMTFPSEVSLRFVVIGKEGST